MNYKVLFTSHPLPPFHFSAFLQYMCIVTVKMLVNKPKDTFHLSYIHVFESICIYITHKKMGEEGLAFSFISQKSATCRVFSN